MRRAILALTLTLCAACGQTALEQARLAGLASKQTAESAYLTVRIEYLLGHVDEATMAEARALYAAYEAAQSAYAAAIEAWEGGRAPGDLDLLKRQIAALAAALQAVRLRAVPAAATKQPL